MKKPVLHMCLNRMSRFCSLASLKTDITYRNPCIKLSQYLEIPLLEEKEKCLSPNIRTMQEAQNLFIPKPGHDIKWIASTIDPQKFPDHDIAEIAFIGRSNVGKSSLLKAIFKDAPELRVKVSRRPGHTKSAQFIRVGQKMCLVDMPGYGFGQPEWFTECVECYLKYRRNLVRTFFLIDGKVGFNGWDEVALNMLEEFKIPYAIIMTKIDKVSDGRLLRNLIHLKQVKDQRTSLCCFPQPFLVSSSTYEGMAHLLAFIGHITGNLNVDPK